MDVTEEISATELFMRMKQVNQMHTQDKTILIEALRKRFGDGVLDVIEQAECEKARQQWQIIASQQQDHSIEALIALLWEPLRSRGCEYSVEKQPDGVQIHCTKCPFFDMAKETGATEWMYRHTCCTDPAITEAFNPAIGFKRTKTLMQGDDCCDHFYYYKD